MQHIHTRMHADTQVYLFDEDVRQMWLLKFLQGTGHLFCIATAQVLPHGGDSCGLVLQRFCRGGPSCGAVRRAGG